MNCRGRQGNRRVGSFLSYETSGLFPLRRNYSYASCRGRRVKGMGYQTSVLGYRGRVTWVHEGRQRGRGCRVARGTWGQRSMNGASDSRRVVTNGTFYGTSYGGFTIMFIDRLRGTLYPARALFPKLLGNNKLFIVRRYLFTGYGTFTLWGVIGNRLGVLNWRRRLPTVTFGGGVAVRRGTYSTSYATYITWRSKIIWGL